MDTKNVDVPVVVTRRDDVRDIVHGHELVDPYRWLEDGASPETRAWTREQNERTAAVLDAVPGRERLEALLGELLQVGSLTGARHVRGRFFYTRREGTQDQPILYVKDGVDGAERPLVDPNERGTAGLVALDWWYPSQDGSLLAYGLSANGDEWSVLRVLDVATGEDRDISIPRARSCSVAWLPDNSGFYYTRYPEPGTVPAGEENYHRHVFFHAFGSDPDADPDVFGEQCRPEDLLSVRTDATGRWLVVEVFEGWAKASLHVLDRERPDAGFRRVTPVVDAIFEAIEIDDGTLYALTNHDAPMFRVIARDLAAGEETAWSTIVAERPERVIETFRLTASGVVTAELESAIGRIRHYGRDGTPLGELPLPGIGGVLSLDASPASDVVVVGYFSFVQPHTALVYGPDGTAGRELHPVPAPSAFVPDDYEISQVRYPSRDGTLVSMFLVHRKGLARDGSHPLYLTGYGGFNLSRGSEYVPELPAWLMQGGIYALPNLRGGNEYGEAWHRDGMLDRKQNTFDDLITAAEWLIAEGYTSPQRLAISGRSNGGLLVGAALTQRPDLFRAVLCGVPLLDMVRYHHFRIARLWIPEYGSSDDPEQAEWLLAYSPYHHVEKGTVYPATLITTGEEDSRVDPMHARKMTALLQWATAGGADRPILLRAEANAGHGQGKPLNKRVAESADQWGFIGWQLGLDWSSDS
ncbi:MAG TPA: prolyl oligopeptidase family serine peptidase [Thermomicrobiales bacterium]|nr:prolyl oligopeptidase family serine peptidase [Thermomicrobiales bacterium]